MFKVLYNDTPPFITEAFSLPKERQRFLWYTGKIPTHAIWDFVSLVNDDDKIVYTEKTYKPKFGSALYPQVNRKVGFCYEKGSKKLQMWWGSTVYKFRHIELLVKELGLEWLVNEGFLVKTAVSRHREPCVWLTNSVFRDVLMGKITNPTECAKKIVSMNRFKGVSPEKLRKAIKSGELTKGKMLMAKDAVENLNDIFDNPISSNDFDLLTQAKALDRKISLKWSRNRKNEVHTEWTREIMREEINQIGDESVDIDVVMPEGYELITTKKRLFEEGMIMSHCVYTNYWSAVQRRTYFVIHDHNNNLTIGVGKNGKIDQIHGRRNTPSTVEQKLKVNTDLSDVLEVLGKTTNQGDLALQQGEYEVEMPF